MFPDLRILIIENNYPDFSYLHELFNQTSGTYNIFHKESLSEGIELLKETAIDLVILDLDLPEDVGIEAIRLIKPHIPSTPVVVTAGIDNDKLFLSVMSEGVQDYLVKGKITKDLLIRTVRYSIERKKAQNALLESETKYHQIFDNTLDAIFISLVLEDGTLGKFLDANHLACERYGYSREEFLNMSPRELNAPETKADIPGILNILHEFSYHTYEMIHITRTGKRINVEINSHQFTLADKKVILSIVHDITERKELEEKLRLLAEIADSAPASVTIHDFEGRMLYCNEETARLHGYTKEEFLALNLHQIDVPETEELIAARMMEIREKNKAEFNVRHYRKDGSIIPLNINARIITWGQKKVLLSIGVDLTEREKSQELLRNTMTLLNAAQKLTKTGGWEYDVISQKMSWTEEVYNIFGTGNQYNPDNVQNNIRFYSPGDDRIIEQAFYKAVEEGEPYDLELKLQKKDGEQIWVHTMGKPEYENNTIVKVSGYIADITERKTLELSLREALQKLRLLTEITRHDVMNDLMVMLLSIELACETDDPAEWKELLSKAHHAGRILEKTIGFTKEYENFGGIAGDWISLFSVISSSQDEVSLEEIDVHVDLAPGIEIFADPIIQKIFTTLFENSVRHGEKISTIQISTEYHDDNLLVIYSDDGTGIPEKDKKLIFRHGYGKHTGTGLYITREILAIMGMTIRENGEEGKGARFEILIPNGTYRINVLNA